MALFRELQSKTCVLCLKSVFSNLFALLLLVGIWVC
jgi:hypothetical protein